MEMNAPTISTILRECANLQPDDTVLTFMNYDQDWSGVAENLTWSQLYQRSLNVAVELKNFASPGDRVVILAPQGMDYITAFLGALQAGLIAVPLSVPLGGASDERVNSVIHDAAPTAILTTSSAINSVVEYTQRQPGKSITSIIEVDLIDFSSPRRLVTTKNDYQEIAYLQYTSGSTRQPAGVVISHENLIANFKQLITGYFADDRGIFPVDTTLVSWLPFYHDMGLVLGVCAPILGGIRTVLTSPVAFLQRPFRWMQLMANNPNAFSAAPNFAYELAARKISDDEMSGLDLGGIHTILNGSERVQPATMQRFVTRFAPFNLQARVIRPSYGLAEATVYVATSKAGEPPELVSFESDELTAGRAKRCISTEGTSLISYPLPESPIIRIVDPETQTECPEETVGEIWVHGDNVASGYWNKPDESHRTFGATLLSASAGTPEGPWLRTGDSGFIVDSKLFIIGRIKDLLIVYGRNHSPDDIEATIQEITRGRCAAIAVPDDGMERLVSIIELMKRGDSQQEAQDRLDSIKREVTSAISTSHGLSVSDLVLVTPGSIPITTSGKVRRAQCVELYRQNEFARIDA